MDTSSHSKPSSSSSHSPSPASVASSQRRTRDSGLCSTSEIIEIPAYCIDNLNSHQLGKGTYGIVEKTRYRKSRNREFKPAAIKYTSPLHLATLIREAKIMWALKDNPNIIEIYGLYRDPRHGQGVVMEYMDCGSMADLVYERKSIDYTIDHAASWLFQLSSAVNTFHIAEQVHRDLKLQNMLLCNRYRTMKLCDFGTFTAMHQSMTSNRGTPITMAPEVFRCENYDTKSDIYSIGIIMWQIISRNHPYNRDLSVPGLLYNVAVANLRPPELECNEILSDFYKKCWHESPDERPTAADCVEYFGLLKLQYPKGDVPLSDANINGGPAATPPPRAYRPSPLGSASGSGLGMNGRTPTASNHLNPSSGTHRRNRSETISTKPGELPYPDDGGETSASGVFKVPRSQSEAKHLRDAARARSGQRQPHREAPAPPANRRDSNEHERQAVLMQLLNDDRTSAIEPDTRDEKSLAIYCDHGRTNEELADALILKKEVMRAKHEKLCRWPQHQRHSELLERRNYLEQEIARYEWKSEEEDSIISERL